MAAISKALAAALAGLIVSWLMKHNVVIADNLPNEIEMVLASVISFVVVWLAPKNREPLG